MAGKEKTENFEDDFEIDAFDAEDDGFSDDTSASSVASDDSASKRGQVSSSQKKKSGGALFSLLLVGLLGGGAWYAYQNKLIPGLSPSGPALGSESVIPTLPVAEEQANSSNDVDAAALTQNGTEMPPQPNSSSAVMEDGGLSGGAIPVEAESTVSASPEETPAVAPSSNTDSDVLTPMPELSGDSLASLQPLESPDLPEISEAAEKDGTATESDSLSSLSAGSTDIDSLSASSDSNEALTVSDTAAETPSEAPISADSGLDPVLESPAETPNATVSASEGSVPSGSVATQAQTLNAKIAAPAEVTDSSSASLDEDSLMSETEKSVEGVTDTAPVESALAPLSDGSSEPLAVKDLAGSAEEPPAVLPDAAAPAPAAIELAAAPDSPTETAKVASTGSDDESASSPAPVSAASEADDKSVQDTRADKSMAAEEKPAPAKTKAEPVKKAASIKWILKSASPDYAVLYDGRTGDVKTIEVGDRVAGLGKIQSISRVNGKWVVKGTGGKITQ